MDSLVYQEVNLLPEAPDLSLSCYVVPSHIRFGTAISSSTTAEDASLVRATHPIPDRDGLRGVDSEATAWAALARGRLAAHARLDHASAPAGDQKRSEHVTKGYRD